MTDPLTRDELVDIARRVLTHAPRGLRAVIIVTDDAGEWVGVSSTTHYADCRALIRSALDAEYRRVHAPRSMPIPKDEP